MALRNRITEDMKAALRARKTARLSALRLLLAAVKQREVDERKELVDSEVVTVVERLIKQRRDSIGQYEAAGRQDLADAERFEVTVLQEYMPQALSDAELETVVAGAIAAAGAQGPQDMGKVMAALKAQVSGRADMGKVSALVKAKLAR